MTEAHDGLRRHVQEQSALIADLSVEVTRARMGVESTETRTAKLEQRAAVAMRLLWTAVGMLAVAVGLLTVLVVRMGR